LLQLKVPECPNSIPAFTVSDAEEDEEPDEKDIIPNSGFAELYGMKKKDTDKPLLKISSSRSTLKASELVYLLEALTYIIQTAKLPPFEAPKPKETPAPKKSKKGEAAATTTATTQDESSSSSKDDKKTVEVTSSQLDGIIRGVLPNMVMTGVGIDTVKRFVLRLSTANVNAVKMLQPFFKGFLSNPSSPLSKQKYAEVVLSILNVNDSATETRLTDYMTCHMDYLSDLVITEHRSGRTLSEPLESLAVIVNTGGKEVKEAYKRATPSYFSDAMLENAKFKPSYM